MTENHRKDFEEIAKREGFSLATIDAPIYVYEDVLTDVLWEGYQSYLSGIKYNDDPCVDSPVHTEHWRFGYRMAAEVSYNRERNRNE